MIQLEALRTVFPKTDRFPSHAVFCLEYHWRFPTSLWLEYLHQREQWFEIASTSNIFCSGFLKTFVEHFDSWSQLGLKFRYIANLPKKYCNIISDWNFCKLLVVWNFRAVFYFVLHLNYEFSNMAACSVFQWQF